MSYIMPYGRAWTPATPRIFEPSYSNAAIQHTIPHKLGAYTKVMMALTTCDVVEYLVELCTRSCPRIVQAAEIAEVKHMMGSTPKLTITLKLVSFSILLRFERVYSPLSMAFVSTPVNTASPIAQLVFLSTQQLLLRGHHAEGARWS